MKIVFIGTLYRSIRSPVFLLEVFSELMKKYVSKQLELHFWGSIEDCEDEFWPYREFLGEKIFIHGINKRAEVVRAMSDADILVNIGNQTDYQLPSKIIEYISMGKPILNIVKNENDCSEIFLKKYRKSLTILEKDEISESGDIERILRFLEEKDNHEDSREIENLIEPYTVKAITGIYERLLEDIIMQKQDVSSAQGK